MVLILSHPADRHADAVKVHLHAEGVQVHHIDTATLGSPHAGMHARLDAGMLTGQLAGIDLARVVGVWHRRPSQFAVSDPDDVAELRAGVGGVLATLPYLNHPADMAAASLKPYQLALAGRCGLLVPPTMICTTRSEAARFAADHGDAVVVKPMSRQVHRLVDADDRSGWQRAAHLTQQRITTTRHVRLTVVDSTMFAARIDSPHLDWRRDPDACTHQAVDTPETVAAPVRRLLGQLRLRYGALDFALDPQDDRWWFLEVNPNGQWLWIEHTTGLPIAAAIATALRQPPTPSLSSVASPGTA
jgi:hypothetical protein